MTYAGWFCRSGSTRSASVTSCDGSASSSATRSGPSIASTGAPVTVRPSATAVVDSSTAGTASATM